MILSNPGGVGWLKFSNTASRIAPSSTERDDRYKLLQNRRNYTVEDWEYCALDAEDGGVEVLAVTEDVELHVVIGEAQHVSLLAVTDVTIITVG